MDENKVNELAAQLLDHLATLLPEEDVNADLGRAVLERALETYNEESDKEETVKGEATEEAAA